MENERQIVRGLEVFNKHTCLPRKSKPVYILTNYNTTFDEDIYRVRKVIELGYKPDVRIYRKGTEPQFLTDLQRWANNRPLFESTSFEDYRPRTDNKTIKQLYGTKIRF